MALKTTRRKQVGAIPDPCCMPNFAPTGCKDENGNLVACFSPDEYLYASTAEGGSRGLVRCTGEWENIEEGRRWYSVLRTGVSQGGCSYQNGCQVTLAFSFVGPGSPFCTTHIGPNDGYEWSKASGSWMLGRRDDDGVSRLIPHMPDPSKYITPELRLPLAWFESFMEMKKLAVEAGEFPLRRRYVLLVEPNFRQSTLAFMRLYKFDFLHFCPQYAIDGLCSPLLILECCQQDLKLRTKGTVMTGETEILSEGARNKEEKKAEGFRCLISASLAKDNILRSNQDGCESDMISILERPLSQAKTHTTADLSFKQFAKRLA
ncbi:hypothetical protein KCU62_g9915, partial [Aureobasidium sp. EXF-3399]